MIEIDGSRGEGGGQILRSALSLSAVLQRELRIFNIRAGRPEPGLKAQHLTGAKAVVAVTNASVRGLQIGSTELIFRPGQIRGGFFRFDVGTAGSITLVLQALMPLFPFASEPVTMEVSGGTDVKWSPPVDYLRLVILPILTKLGFDMSLNVVRRGHYPRGGGLVKVTSHPNGRLKSLEGMEAGEIEKTDGITHAVGLPRNVAERQAAESSAFLISHELPKPIIEVEAPESISQLGPGSGIVLRSTSRCSAVLGGDCLGERGLPAEEVGRIAAKRLVEEVQTRAYLDRHMADIIVPYIALAEGVSDLTVSQVTQHCITNVEVAEQVAGVHFDLPGKIDRVGRLRVKGLGLA